MEKEKTLQRFNQALDYLKSKGRIHKQQDLVESIGIGKSHISEFVNGKERYFTELNLKRFAEAYKDLINEEWLINGTGNMETPDPRMHPLLEASAAAGFLGGISSPELGDNLMDIDAFFPDFDFFMRASGHSMEPLISDGDILICRRLTDSQNPPLLRICIIDTKDAAVVKQISRISRHNLTAHSLNPDYPDQLIDFDSINGVALVLGVLRLCF